MKTFKILVNLNREMTLIAPDDIGPDDLWAIYDWISWVASREIKRIKAKYAQNSLEVWDEQR